MKILSPVSKAEETEKLILAGADELYCGIIPPAWQKEYSNLASLNRREWAVSNLSGFDELDEIRYLTKSWRIPLYIALNALYTREQYPNLEKFLKDLLALKPDALIVADLGLMLYLKELKIRIPVHASTGCTVFNLRSARFFKAMGVSRIILPRQFNIKELLELAEKLDFMEKEVFIFNSGCRNIDGFCTFQHGVQELTKKELWKIPKALGLDYHLLCWLRTLPRQKAEKFTRFLGCMPDSACLLNYRVKILEGSELPEAPQFKKWLEANFHFYFGLDPCGACALYPLFKAKIDAVKIVGRENPSPKKIKDVQFLKKVLNQLDKRELTETAFREFCKREYRKIYGFSCQEWCYYPALRES